MKFIYFGKSDFFTGAIIIKIFQLTSQGNWNPGRKVLTVIEFLLFIVSIAWPQQKSTINLYFREKLNLGQFDDMLFKDLKTNKNLFGNY